MFFGKDQLRDMEQAIIEARAPEVDEREQSASLKARSRQPELGRTR
jgi:hypothetical protein